VIGILGIPLASVATIISSAAIAVGLALQGSLSNLAGGIVILAFKPFHVGDVIQTGSYNGTVESIGVFYTTLTTFDNQRVVLPNAGLSNANITNASAFDTRRVDLIVSAGLLNFTFITGRVGAMPQRTNSSRMPSCKSWYKS